MEYHILPKEFGGMCIKDMMYMYLDLCIKNYMEVDVRLQRVVENSFFKEILS